MRKDVKCTFGIMKGSFSILRYGLRFQSITKCDQMWLTCCALHNLLLEYDGLDTNWEESQLTEDNETSFAMSRLGNPSFHPHPSNNDNGLIGNGSISLLCREYTRNNCRVVRKMPFELFKQCLINHFDIRFKKNDIVWPQSVKRV